MYEHVTSVQGTVTFITQVKLRPVLLKMRIQSLSCMALGCNTTLFCVIIQMNNSQESFLFSDSPGLCLGPIQSPIQRVSEFLLGGLKRPEREVDHSPASSTRQAMYVYA